MKIHVYTREVEADSYPEGLANSIHLEYITDDGERHPLNRNYGILFAKGCVSDENTIVPKGIKDPKIFRMADGRIGITGERVMEDGEPDLSAEGRVLLWTTEDLIDFSEEELMDTETITAEPDMIPSDMLEVAPELVEGAARYWEPIVFSHMEVPGRVRVSSETELDNVYVSLVYSDGSHRDKRFIWDKSEVDFSKPGTYIVTGRVAQKSYSFPLAKGYGDPVIFRWEGKWYYISTNDNLNDIGIYVREADDVDGLFAEGVVEHLILPFDPSRGFEQTFWAPEFHVIGGELYILFAVSGHKWGPQCHMMKLKPGGSIIDEAGWEDPVRVVRRDGSYLADEAITLDMTYLKTAAGSYVIWSYRENIATPLDSGSMLYIAAVNDDEPWKLTSDPVLLTRPLYGWENVSGTINNEGPHAFIKDGYVYVTYSGGAANGYTYVLGLLTASVDADLLDIGSWTKSKTPVLSFYSVKGEYGPGHNSFYTDEEGDLMIAYHAEMTISDNLRCDGIRRVHFREDGTPYFQMSSDDDFKEAEVSIEVEVIV